jgi:hypothetical protein
MQKVNQQDYNYHRMVRLLKQSRLQLNKIREELTTEIWAKNDVMNFNLVDDLIEINENFENTINSHIAVYQNNKSKAS